MSTDRYDFTEREFQLHNSGAKLLYISSAKYNGDWYSFPHTHNFTEVFYVIGGAGKFQIRDSYYKVSVGDMVILNPNIEHTETSMVDDPLEYIVLGIRGIKMSAELDPKQDFSIIHFNEAAEEIQRYLLAMLQEAKNKKNDYEEVCGHLLDILLICLMRLEGCAQLELKKLRFYPDEALRMIQIGLPAGLQSVIFNISNVMIQSSINSFGADVVAANTAAGNLDSFIYTACNSVYHASMTFTSQNLGAGKPERIKPVYRDCILTVLLIGVPMCALLYFFGRPLLGIYIAKDDPAYASVLASGMVRVTYMGMTYFVCGIMETCCGMVRGLGRSWMPMVVTIFGACVLRIIWIYTIFQTHHTLDVLYLSYPVSWVVTSAVHVLCFILIYRRMMARWNAHKEEENASY